MGTQSADHYFSSQPSTPLKRRPLKVVLAGEERDLETAGGIFSPAGVDKGTAILLSEVPPPAPEGNLLDIGCGWGPVALSLALRSPHASVFAVDVNERSIDLTRDNAVALGLTNVRASSPDAVDPDLRFNTIWSNPPIRVGKDELHSILLMWLPRLASGGSAYLVVQKNLGSDSLQRWLTAELAQRFPEAGLKVSRYSTNKAFRVLRILRTAD
ncbi:class I SAM-dependent methyltransferase [Arthrobacter cryoconiti]|uniref:Class I SAM-dependent methyltransferase n=1 Tax=Arthrobacter cryoconiti TaxID=748907 RepID=A0ABV8R3E7_9MICC|nr:methyltransferase [Arthrobacter cryoconiti]MCC9067248.1 class I SAM-dependent methyltransferase [Arthrobacter cryoconiti]